MMMRPELLALYGGPDQIMGVASGLATLAGLAMMFMNKILVALGKVTNWFRPSVPAQDPPQDSE